MGGGRASDTGGGLRGTSGKALNVSDAGLTTETPNGGRGAGGNCGCGNCGCGDGGTNTSVGGSAGGRDVGTGGGASATTSSRSPNSSFHALRPPTSSTGTRLRNLRNAVSYIARSSLASGASEGPGVSEASS